MTDQDPDARIPDPEPTPPSDADLVLDAQPVFEPDATPVETPVTSDPDAPSSGAPEQVAGSADPADPAEEVGEGVGGVPPTDDPAEHTGFPSPEPAPTEAAGAADHTDAPAGPADLPAPEQPNAEGTGTGTGTGTEDSDPSAGAEASAASPEGSPEEPLDLPTPHGTPSQVADPSGTEDTAPATSWADVANAMTTGHQERSTTSTHIPVVPAPSQDTTEREEATQTPSSTAQDGPGTPPDVLGHRDTHRGHDETSETATTQRPPTTPGEGDPVVGAAVGIAATQRTSILNASGAREDAQGATTGGEDELDQTRVRRRSFVAPQEEAPEEGAESQWRPRSSQEESEQHTASTPRSLDDALFDGATVVPEVPSRVGAHVWSLLLTLVLVPVGWYLLADAGARMTLATGNPMSTGVVNPAALIELAGGLLVVVVVALLARRSSLGAHVIGIVVTILGLPWVVAPGATARLVRPAMEWLDQWNAFGANLVHHLQASGYSGRLLLLGVVLVLAGWISHRVRRVGREEETLRAEVERVNPQGAHLTWRARRRAARAAGER
ncbi:MAG: hypothetical protein L0K65_00165 [Actinomyces sp.]|nr:hypothetical protein [Actinomyces sp.]